MKRIYRIGLLSLLFFANIAVTFSCTTAVISGKFTKSGRPMVWKVRDTDYLSNSMKSFDDGKWEYMGLINAQDTLGKEIWGGHNAMGFAIMNSASFNVNQGDPDSIANKEGIFMREALKTCITLADFEELLNKRPRPMGLAAHFGVIDAKGGAAFYEVNNETWTKFDANDSKVAPQGYILRTNFSHTGEKDKGLGYIRCQTAELLFKQIPMRSLTIEKLMQDFSRCTINPILDVNYRKEYSALPFSNKFVNSDDLICRHGTSSTIAIEGIVPGKEKPEYTTTWIQLGLPYISVTIPVWTGYDIPRILRQEQPGEDAPLAHATLEIKQRKIFPIGRSDGYHYLSISHLFNKEQTGITQRVENIEKDIFQETESCRNEWGNKGRNKQNNPTALYKRFMSEVERLYQELLLEK